jgi:transcriptional regulator with XRE-family HTH domain
LTLAVTKTQNLAQNGPFVEFCLKSTFAAQIFVTICLKIVKSYKFVTMIGKNIKAFREKMGLSQEEVADFLNVKREMVSYYETDAREVPMAALEKLSDLFGIDLGDLIEEDEKQVSANVALAFRAENMGDDDLKGVAEFRKIIKNYFKILELEKKISK